LAGLPQLVIAVGLMGVLVVAEGGIVILGGFTVSTNVVVFDRPPGSVARSVIILTPETEGVPVITVPFRLSPAGNPTAEITSVVGV